MSRFNPETGDFVLQMEDGTFKDYSKLCFGSGSGTYEYEEEDGWVLAVRYDENAIKKITMARGKLVIRLTINLNTIQYITN